MAAAQAALPATAPAVQVVAPAAATIPGAVTKPAAAQAPSAAQVAGIPAAATVPSSVPAGGGSSAPGQDFPVWGAAMIVTAALVAAGAGMHVFTTNNR